MAFIKPMSLSNLQLDLLGGPGLSVPRVLLVPPLLLTENMGSVLGSAGLSPSLR